MATVTTEGRRVYVKTQYGEAVVDKLKKLGAHWDRDRKAWWLTSQKEQAVRQLVSDNEGRKAEEDPDKIQVVGKATYKGKTYFVRWQGETASGGRKARLVTLDGQIDFWAAVASGPPGEKECVIIKHYGEPMTLGSLKRFVEKQQRKRQDAESRGERYDPPVAGCGNCRLLGRMCDRCRFDEYDD